MSRKRIKCHRLLHLSHMCRWWHLVKCYIEYYTFMYCVCLCKYFTVFTTRKRSLWRLCFHRCLSVYGGGSLSGEGGSLSGEGGSLSRGVSVMEIPQYSNMRAVRILLECILVCMHILISHLPCVDNINNIDFRHYITKTLQKVNKRACSLWSNSVCVDATIYKCIHKNTFVFKSVEQFMTILVL